MGQIDDVVDASVVHGLCGLWGMVSAGLFVTEAGYGRAFSEVRCILALALQSSSACTQRTVHDIGDNI